MEKKGGEGKGVEAESRADVCYLVLEWWQWGWTKRDGLKYFMTELSPGLSGYEWKERKSKMTPRFFF